MLAAARGCARRTRVVRDDGRDSPGSGGDGASPGAGDVAANLGDVALELVRIAEERAGDAVGVDHREGVNPHGAAVGLLVAYLIAGGGLARVSDGNRPRQKSPC